jgi:hypothetical protein
MRKFGTNAKNDIKADDTQEAIDSYVIIGPGQLRKDTDFEAILNVLHITTDQSTDRLDYEIYLGTTAEEAMQDAINQTNCKYDGYHADGGRTRTIRPRMRGLWLAVRLSCNYVNKTWALEQITAKTTPQGRIRT